MARARTFYLLVGAFLSLGLPASTLFGLDIYYQAVHQESSIKQQPPVTYDRVLGLYLSDRNRLIKLPEDEKRRDLLDLEKTIHLRLFSGQTQESLDRTNGQNTTGIQVVEAFVQTTGLTPSQVRAGKFISQLQGEIYPRTPYAPGFITPPEMMLTTFGAEGLSGIGVEWVRFWGSSFTWDVTYQAMKTDNPLLAGPHQNGTLHSLALNSFDSIGENGSYSIAFKAGGAGLGTDEQVSLWTTDLSYTYTLAPKQNVSLSLKWLSAENKSRPSGKVRGGYLVQILGQVTKELTVGLRRDAAGLQAHQFDGLRRTAAVATVWLSEGIAFDAQKSFLAPKGADAFNQTHFQLRLSLLKI